MVPVKDLSVREAALDVLLLWNRWIVASALGDDLEAYNNLQEGIAALEHSFAVDAHA
jgi:hypothetical protein